MKHHQHKGKQRRGGCTCKYLEVVPRILNKKWGVKSAKARIVWTPSLFPLPFSLTLKPFRLHNHLHVCLDNLLLNPSTQKSPSEKAKSCAKPKIHPQGHLDTKLQLPFSWEGCKNTSPPLSQSPSPPLPKIPSPEALCRHTPVFSFRTSNSANAICLSSLGTFFFGTLKIICAWSCSLLFPSVDTRKYLCVCVCQRVTLRRRANAYV